MKIPKHKFDLHTASMLSKAIRTNLIAADMPEAEALVTEVSRRFLEEVGRAKFEHHAETCFERALRELKEGKSFGMESIA